MLSYRINLLNHCLQKLCVRNYNCREIMIVAIFIIFVLNQLVSNRRKNADIMLYRLSRKFLPIAFVQIERTKLSRKVLYHFAIFVIVNKILIIKNCQILILNNFLLKYYQFYRKTAKDKNHLFFSHRTLKIFSEFFINFLVLHFFIFTNMKKYGIK